MVDEGHVVFSHQPDPQLHGQHRFADPSKVRDLLERTLAPKAAVVVFHDENYQRSTKKATSENFAEFFEEMDRRSDLAGLKAEVNAAFEAGNRALTIDLLNKVHAIPYPRGCISTAAPLPIVRNPGTVRDVSVRFSKTLDAHDREVANRTGRQSYPPLLDEGTANAAGKDHEQ